MPTKLEKPIVRESSEMVDKRNIMVCFQTDQTIRLKLKGMKSGVLTIGVKDLYEYLFSKENNSEKTRKQNNVSCGEDTRVKGTDEPMINLDDFRSAYMVLDVPYDVKVRIEAIAMSLINPFRLKREERRLEIRKKEQKKSMEDADE